MKQLPTCTECGRPKKPVGRDSFDNGLCDHECPGYRKAPEPGHVCRNCGGLP
jgi:hypothetical protein